MLKKNNARPDDLTVRFPAGTLDKIRKVLKARERQTDFIRSAVEEMLQKDNWPDALTVRFEVLKENAGSQSDFIRAATEEKLRRRRRPMPKKG